DALALADRIQLAAHQASTRCTLVAAYASAGNLERALATQHEILSLYSLYEPSLPPVERAEGETAAAADDGLRRSPREAINPSRRFFLDRSVPFLATVQLEAGEAESAIAALQPLIDGRDRQLVLTVRSCLAHAL